MEPKKVPNYAPIAAAFTEWTVAHRRSLELAHGIGCSCGHHENPAAALNVVGAHFKGHSVGMLTDVVRALAPITEIHVNVYTPTDDRKPYAVIGWKDARWGVPFEVNAFVEPAGGPGALADLIAGFGAREDDVRKLRDLAGVPSAPLAN